MNNILLKAMSLFMKEEMASGYDVREIILENTRSYGESKPLVWEAHPQNPIDYNLYKTCNQPKSDSRRKVKNEEAQESDGSRTRISNKRKLACKAERRQRVKESVSCIDDDISCGKELVSISVVNTIDNEKPLPFKYVNRVIYPNWCRRIPPKGCECPDGCTDSNQCDCAVKNGGVIPFNSKGAIIKAKPLIHECGPSCKCPPSCLNRVSQHGIKFPLQIFKTESRGWGVRSLTSIPSGSFICEYIGELIEDKEAEKRIGNDEYLFDIENNYCNHNIDVDTSVGYSDEILHFTIDAAECGNVGRFINHSCSPNLYVQNVVYDFDDERISHIMIFAAKRIPPLQELTYHYNYTIDQVLDSYGNVKCKSCYCGSLECTGRMY